MLKNKVALVTGASQGIGFECANSLAAKGCNLVLVSRNKDNLIIARNYIKSKYPIECLVIRGDVSSSKLQKKVIEKIKKKYSRLDILINNAGGPPMGSFLKHNDLKWQKALSQNLMSVINFTKLSFSLMKKNKFGRVINILTVLAKEPTSQMVLSSTVRSGVMAFSKAVSHEIGSFGITINNICPGGVLTNRFQTLLNERAKKLKISKKEFYKQRAATVPIGRFAKPEEIANIILFLCKDESEIITGTSIVADGGQSKSI